MFITHCCPVLLKLIKKKKKTSVLRVKHLQLYKLKVSGNSLCSFKAELPAKGCFYLDHPGLVLYQ